MIERKPEVGNFKNVLLKMWAAQLSDFGKFKMAAVL